MMLRKERYINKVETNKIKQSKEGGLVFPPDWLSLHQESDRNHG